LAVQKKREKRQQGVQSVEIGLRVATALAEFDGPTSLSDLARATSMSPSKVHRYLVSLSRAGLVKQDHSEKYDFSDLAIRLGLAALSRLDEFQLAGEILDELHDQAHLPVAAAAWNRNGPVFVRRAESVYPLMVATRIGSQPTVLNSSPGRAFAAYLPAHISQPVIAAELAAGVKPIVDGKVLAISGFHKLLQNIRRTGIAASQGDAILGFEGIAVPVFDADGHIVMTLSMAANRANLLDVQGKCARLLRKAGEKLSSQLGFRSLPITRTTNPPHLAQDDRT